MAAVAALGAQHPPRAVSVRLRLLAVVSCCALAYPFSLYSLFGDWRYDTPLADLALVPLLGAFLLFARSRRFPHLDWLRLGGVDVAVAALCMLLAFGLLAVGPVVWSKYFWAGRFDLVTLPLFAVAAVVLLLGARAIVSLGSVLVFLLLAWPLPYLIVLEHALSGFTRLTELAVGQVVLPAGLAKVNTGADGGAFVVQHHGSSFIVSVASACSGVNSLVGFLVVAVFVMYLVRGTLLRKVAWLCAGALLVWFVNVLRIVVVLAVGGALGERAAFRILHPVSGLLALNAAALVLVLVMRRFGLRWQRDPVEVDSPLAETAEPEQRAVPSRIALRLSFLVVAAVVFALANGQLRAAAKGFSNDGRPAVSPFVTSPVPAPGWSLRRLARLRFATPYYGAHSVWVRYRLRPLPNDRRPFTLWLDAITSPDLGALDAYTLAHCYAFHGFDVDVARRLDLGDGVAGQAFVYRTKDAYWHAVSWQWPVLGEGGDVEHERIVLLASSPVRGPAAAGHSSGGLWRAVLSVLNLRARNHDDNAGLTRAMQGVASEMVKARVESRT